MWTTSWSSGIFKLRMGDGQKGKLKKRIFEVILPVPYTRKYNEHYDNFPFFPLNFTVCT